MGCLGKIVFALILFAAGGYAFPSYSSAARVIRYRLTVDVNVDGTHRIDSAVVESQYKTGPRIADSPGETVKFEGYAITVDLGERGLLFILNDTSALRVKAKDASGSLVGSTPLALLAPEVFRFSPLSLEAMRRPNYWQSLINFGAESRPIDFAILPLMAHFRNIENRNSIEEVDPDHLDRSFGPGVSLDSVTIRFVDEPLSPMPESWPGWLKADRNSTNRGRWHRPGRPIEYNPDDFFGDGD